MFGRFFPPLNFLEELEKDKCEFFECSIELVSEAIGPGLLVIRSFLFTVSISWSISLFTFFFRTQSYRLYGSRNVSTSFGLFNVLTSNCLK